jgi:hypothetical protein
VVRDILQGKDIKKCVQYRRLRWYDQVERMQNQKMLKQTAKATLGRRRKIRRPRKDGGTRFKRA